MRPAHPRADDAMPIFLFGVLERSGTNFLSDLLCRHPACAPVHPLDEDFFHFSADLLEGYARHTVSKWHPDWGLSESGADELLAAIGSGLLGFLREKAEASSGRSRLVTKTPSVKNLSMFPRLFPGAPAVVLMRDGRSVVESGVRSFGFTYEEQTRKWAWAASVIAETVGTISGNGQPGAAGPYLLVRYEDVVTDPESELRRIFAFTGLDPNRYDFAGVERLPVRGSSTFRGKEQDVNWTPVEPSENFKPLERWRHWTSDMHDRFNWLGGPELVDFGYAPFGPTSGLLYELRNRMKDVALRVRS